MGTKEQRRLADEWPRPTLEWFIGQLARLLERGAYAEVLHEDAPELVEELCPPDANLNMSNPRRAKEAEIRIRKAIEAMGPDYHEDVKEALLRRLGLREGLGLKGGRVRNNVTTRKRRQRSAAEAVGLNATRTFESKYLPEYIEALARKLYADMVA